MCHGSSLKNRSSSAVDTRFALKLSRSLPVPFGQRAGVCIFSFFSHRATNFEEFAERQAPTSSYTAREFAYLRTTEDQRVRFGGPESASGRKACEAQEVHERLFRACFSKIRQLRCTVLASPAAVGTASHCRSSNSFMCLVRSVSEKFWRPTAACLAYCC